MYEQQSLKETKVKYHQFDGSDYSIVLDRSKERLSFYPFSQVGNEI